MSARRFDGAMGALLALVTALSGLAFSVAFRLAALAIVVAIAAVASVTISWLAVPARASVDGARGTASRTRPSLARTAIAWVGWLSAFVVLGMVAARELRPMVVVNGVVSGWADLLASAVPADPRGPVVMVPLVVTWLAGTIAVVIVKRTQSVVFPVAPAVVTLVIGLAFAAGDPARRVSTVALALLIACMLATVRLRSIGPEMFERERRSTPVARRAGRGVVVGLLAIGVGSIGVIAAPRLVEVDQRTPFRLRDHYDGQRLDRPAPNPLASLAATQRSEAKAAAEQRDPTVAFEVEASDPVERYRLAVLDSYDGEQWSSTARFLGAGSELQPAIPISVPTRTVHQNIHVRSLEGYWLPTADQPVGVSSHDLLTDPASGMLATRAASANGTDVEIDASVPIYDADQLRRADLPDADLASPYLAVPANTPESLYTLAQTIVAGADLPVQRAFQIQEHLRKNLTSLPEDQAVPGHSIAKLTRLLTDPTKKQGSPEQFAAAFALLARLDGLPTRIVVGYRGPFAAGSEVVSQQQLTAWPEVLFEGLGWVPFDPEPELKGQAGTEATIEEAEAESAVSEVVEQAASNDEQAGQQEEELPTNTGDEEEPPPSTVEQVFRYALIAFAILLGVLVLLLVATAIVKRRRRGRRAGASDARARVIGAWHETIDRLSETGVDVRSSTNATELARRGRKALHGGDDLPLKSLAQLSNEAMYSDDALTGEQADQAWDYVDVITRDCRRARSNRQSARALLDPRRRARHGAAGRRHPGS